MCRFGMLASLFVREASLLIDSELFRPYEIAARLWEDLVPFLVAVNWREIRF